MKKKHLFISAGMISLLLLLFLTGCGSDTLKSAQNSPQEEVMTEEESGEDIVTSGSEGESSQDESQVIPTENPETNCSALNPHPMAEGMAETFEVSYDQVMTWYCDGSAFSDILLALETEQLVDQSPEELLSMLEDSTWEEIWQELGVEK
jgi:hypothetical protein